ncbi:hypothetical protein HYU13_02700 [Candidatus Woesearchaeota archaeon]|nr:hypothetical protein [Candidatus Woesearchaeota archaeon]
MGLTRQIDAVRDAYNSNGDIDQEIAKLHQSIGVVLAKEARLLGIQQNNGETAQEIVGKIKDCRLQLDEINGMLAAMKGDIRGLVAQNPQNKGPGQPLLSNYPPEHSGAKEKIQKRLASLREKFKQVKRANKLKDEAQFQQRIDHLRQRLRILA